MNIRIFETTAEAGVYAASLLERVVQSQPRPILGLATGETVLPLYQSLVRMAKWGLDFSGVTTVNLDEYVGLSPDHPQSYHAFMARHLFEHINIHHDNIHIPRGHALPPEAECARYDELIRRHPIDLQVLGIGRNGHIGFNEPDDLLFSNTHLVNLSADTIRSNARFFDDESQVPRQAITMGVQSILQAKQIVLMAFGLEKADIVAKSIHGGVRTDIPATILQLHRDVTVILDKDSATALPAQR